MSIQKITTNAAGTQIKKTTSPGERLQPSIIGYEERIVEIETELNLEHTDGTHAISGEETTGMLTGEDYTTFLRKKAPDKRQCVLSGKVDTTTGLPTFLEGSNSETVETSMIEKYTFENVVDGTTVIGEQGIADGTMVGTTLNAIAKVGTASTFYSGSDDYILFPYSNDFIPEAVTMNQSWTFSVWFNITQDSNYDTFLTIGDSSNHFAFGLNGRVPALSFYNNSGGTSRRYREATTDDMTNNLPSGLLDGTQVALDTWMLMTVVYDNAANLASIYINDNLLSSWSIGNRLAGTGAAGITLGSTGYQGFNPLHASTYPNTQIVTTHGFLDNFRIWKRALNATEVAEVYSVDNVGGSFPVSRAASIRASVDDPLVVTFAQGYDEYGAKDIIRALKSDITINIDALAGGSTAYIYLDADDAGNVTPGWTDQYPIHLYTQIDVDAGSTNNDIFTIPQMKMRTHDGTVINRLYIGEIETSGIGAITAVRPYAIRCETVVSTGTITAGVAGTPQFYPVDHNIGHLFEQLEISCSFRGLDGFMGQVTFQSNGMLYPYYTQSLQCVEDITRSVTFNIFNTDAYLWDNAGDTGGASQRLYTTGEYIFYIKRKW